MSCSLSLLCRLIDLYVINRMRLGSLAWIWPNEAQYRGFARRMKRQITLSLGVYLVSYRCLWNVKRNIACIGKPRYTRHIRFSKLCNMGSEIKINQKCNKIGSVADGNHKIYLVSPYRIVHQDWLRGFQAPKGPTKDRIRLRHIIVETRPKIILYFQKCL